MISFKIFHINAFSSEVFRGNPAGVIPLNFWIPDNLMQKIAFQNGLSETAFFVKTERGYKIRWFTPKQEVDLCGHATIASAMVLNEFLANPDEKVIFESKSDDLIVNKIGDKYFLKLLAEKFTEIPSNKALELGIGQTPTKVLKAGDDIVAVLASEEAVSKVKPNFEEITKLNSRGLIITAKGNDVDFVARFFAPNVGVPEDPVTGSIYNKLAPFWSPILDKTKLVARQLSERSGEIFIEINENDVWVGGEASPYLKGEIFVKNN